MMGLLGLLGWKVTVISSNFIALMLILTMAMNIHMSVRYLQFRKENPNFSNSEALLWTSRKMFYPILYTVLTTICAFLSLIFSDIKPIIDFGINAIIRLCNFSNNNDWLVRFYGLESYSNILKFYCFDAYFKHGNEYPYHSEISAA